MLDRPGDDGFDGALAAVAAVDGWMTDAQALRLWRAARRVPDSGQIVEIGSFRGRSTIVLARGAHETVSVVAIDPHGGGDRGPGEIAPDAERGDADHMRFTANLVAAGVAERVRHVRKASSAAHGDVTGLIDLLYIDGAHRYSPARDDIAQWGSRVAPRGSLLIHDAFNAIGVTAAQLRLLVFGARFEYVGRDGSLVEYRRRQVRRAARLRNTARQLAQLGYFSRMVAVKCALTARAYPLARRLGHPGREWPY
ncbi:MAG TPA: class I SAM-dependent methyltransferase [Mycobacteriales bacterium]|nr:class I SAM-dependent methyltransferase [Mycobacteriales bacterium]